MSEKLTQEVREAFEAAISAGKSADEIKVEMLKAGAPFSGITKMYNDLMVETGRMTDPEEKAKIIDSVCSEHDISTEEGFNDAFEEISEKLEGLTERQIASSIRGYAKRNKIDVYKKPRSSTAGRGHAGGGAAAAHLRHACACGHRP